MERSRKWLIAIPILIALLALCAVIVAISLMTVRQIGRADLFPLHLGDYNNFNVSAEAEESKSFTVGAPARLEVRNPCGAIQVRATDGDAVSVTLHKRGWGRDEQEALARLETLKLDAAQTGDTITLGLVDPDSVCDGTNRRPPEAEFIIEAPVETAAQLRSVFGAVALEGTHGATDLSTSFGDVRVRNIEGGLTVETTNGVITAEGIQAGDAEISLNSRFGRIQLLDASAAALSIDSANGGVEVRAVTVAGDVTLGSDFGDISWDEGSARSLTLQSKNGAVTLTGLQIEDLLDASSDFGSIHLDAVSAGSYTVNTKNGRIDLTGAAGPVTAHSDFGDVSVAGDGEHRMDLTSESGSVTYEGGLGEGENVFRTRFGNVHLRLPPESAFDFDMETRFGKITSDFPVTLQGELDEAHWTGAVSGGGPTVTISTENGNITLAYQ